MASDKRMIDMTHGRIPPILIRFAVPLIAGNLFQLLYNMVDTWVIGNYIGNEAFSAVGTVGLIVNVLIGFFDGFSMGTGVVISQFYGAREDKNAHDAVHTAAFMTLVMCVLFTIIGIGMTSALLHLMKVPEEVFPYAKRYLMIYFAGFTGLLIYNMGSAMLRAVGNSTRPFSFLVISTILNIVLDLFFVIKLHFGVAGVAVATVIAQFVSAILVLIELFRAKSCVRLIPKDISLNKVIFSQIFRIAIPTALQHSITCFSNVFAQSYINYFGADCMSGYTVYTKINQIMFLPIQSFGNATATFVAQNIGANNQKRARKGVGYALLIAGSFTVLLIIIILFSAPHVVRIFNSKPEVVEAGTLLLRLLPPFFVICAVEHVCFGALRGAGNTRVPMIIMLSTFVALRQVYLFIVSHFICNELVPILLAFPVAWFACSSAALIYYFYFVHHGGLNRVTHG